MHYKELFEAAKRFKNYPASYDYIYTRARRTDWQNLNTLTTEQIRNEVIRGFLNPWKCRLPNTVERANAIKTTYKEALFYLRALSDETLQDIGFDEIKQVDDQKINHSQIIHHLFSRFSGMCDEFRPVPASKLLHMIRPALFVMWDQDIGREKYGMKLSAYNYAYKFMPLMKKEANEAIDIYMKERVCDRDTAIREIMATCYGKTLAKLVDEYNWINKPR